jgi:hypothetical protein
MDTTQASAGNIGRGLLACRQLRRQPFAECRRRGRIVHPQDGAAVAASVYSMPPLPSFFAAVGCPGTRAPEPSTHPPA